MNIHVLITLSTIILCLIFAEIIYHSNKKNLLNRIFVYFILITVYWIFTTEFMIYLTDNVNTSFAWAKIGFLWLFLIPLFVHFILVFTEKKRLLKSRLTYFILYIPAAAFSIINLTTDLLIGKPQKTFQPYANRALYSESMLYLLFFLWSIISLIVILFLLIRFYFINTSNTKKNQTKYIFIGLFIVLLFSLAEIITVSIGIKFPRLDSVSIMSLIICIGYAIWKYDLFKVDPVKAIENIISIMPDSLFLADIEGKIAETNYSFTKLFGYSEEEIVGKDINILFKNKDKIKIMINNLLQDSEVVNEEKEIETKSGKVIPVLISGSVISNKNKQKIGIVCIARDITERKQSEKDLLSFNKKLQQSNRELQDFAYIASHDLQEPLRKISLFGDRLIAKYQDKIDEQGRDFIERMQSASVRMQKLIDGLLTYSRVSNNVEPFINVNLSQILTDVLSDLEARIEKTKGKVEIGVLPDVNADPTQMCQLFQNLIGNSLKFYKPEEPPVVKVYSMNNDLKGFCSIAVEDNGIGIDEKYYEKIFNVFQRLHGKDEYEGSGIGLAVCKKIVERHGGTIRVESILGKGTRFIIQLPLFNNLY